MLRPSLVLASALAALLALPSSAAPSTATQAFVLDAADPAAAPAAACTIHPSPKDMYRLLTIATDPTCAQHGLGCVSDICRYCRLNRDEAYSNLLICSAIEGFGSGEDVDPLDVIDDGPAFSLQCATTVSTGDAAVGINIATDVSCTIGGVGCLSDLCRFCKVRETPQSASFVPCSAVDTNNGDDVFFTPLPAVAPDATSGPVVGSTDRPTLDVIPISALTTTSAPTTITTAPAPTTANPATTAPPTAAPVTTKPPTAAPVTTAPPTTAPPTTAPPTTRPPTAAPPTTAPPVATAPPTTAPPVATAPPTTAPPVATVDACVASVSSGDQNVGISAYTDAACRTGGLGCFSTACRYCKTFESPQASHWLACPSPTTVAPAPTTLPPAPTTVAPVPTTRAPVPTTTAPPVTPAPTTRDACAAAVSSGDNGVGIFGFTDARCQSGGLGCFSTACRFCKAFDTPQSSYLSPCPSAPAPVPATQAPVPATQAPPPPPPTTTAPPPPPPTTVAPAPTTTRDACAASVSSGDNNVGISAYTDAACRAGGVGCFGTSCRFCKTFNSPQSQQFLACPRA